MPREQDWSETNGLLEGASEAQTLEHMQDIATLMGYDFGTIRFEAMPDHVGGYTSTDYKVNDDEEVVIYGNEIYLNENLMPGDHEDSLVPVPELFRDTIDFYDETTGLQDTFYHELGHGKQFRDIWQDEDPYTEPELMALLPFHEGQTSYNTDDAAYRSMNELYEQFIDTVGETEESAGEVLRDLSETYRIDVVYMDDNEAGVYDFIVSERGDATTEEIYAWVEEAYGMDVLEDQSYEVDYRMMDADRLGDHLVRVQEQLDEGFEQVANEYGEATLPTGYVEHVIDQPSQ